MFHIQKELISLSLVNCMDGRRGGILKERKKEERYIIHAGWEEERGDSVQSRIIQPIISFRL
jgi:hypothetical protein